MDFSSGTATSKLIVTKMTINIVLADDHPIFMLGMERLLATTENIKVIATCNDGKQALKTVRELNPDILVLDLKMPHMDGLTVLREMRQEQLATKTVLLTAELDEDKVIEAMRHGVGGFVLKEMAPQSLIQCIRIVYAGGQWLEKCSIKLAFDKLLRRDIQQLHRTSTHLTPREEHLVRLVYDGLSNRDIANKLHISEGTVKTHLHNIFDKLGIKNRVELARYAKENL